MGDRARSFFEGRRIQSDRGGRDWFWRPRNHPPHTSALGIAPPSATPFPRGSLGPSRRQGLGKSTGLHPRP